MAEKPRQEVRVILTYDAPLDIDPRMIRRNFEVLLKGQTAFKSTMPRLELMKVEVKEEGEIYNGQS